MRELGLHVGNAVPRRLTEDVARSADILVTMGCGESCPVVPGIKRIEWDLPDPKGRSVEAVRGIRDQIRELVAGLIEVEGLR
jgi:arsenate reductase